MKIKVLVPATSANLGPGFDVLGIAVGLYNEFIVEEAPRFEIVCLHKLGGITTNKENLFYKSFSFLFIKNKKKVPQVKITMNLQIPPARGLGSSATAVVGGLLAANNFLHNLYTKEQLLSFALKLEVGNNPDNVAPALLGGLIVLTENNNELHTVKLQMPLAIKAVYFIPDFEMDTVTGRKLMPKEYAREDVVFSTSRVALLLAALQTKQFDLLRVAMQDRIHQPTRTKIFPQMPNLIKAANDAGALGAALSGGGSTILAFADKNFASIEKAMKIVGQNNKVPGMTKTLKIVNEGATVTLL
jgi:homoserine kinase